MKRIDVGLQATFLIGGMLIVLAGLGLLIAGQNPHDMIEHGIIIVGIGHVLRKLNERP